MATTFKNNTGKTWALTIDAPSIAEIRRELDGLDLADFDSDVYERLYADPVLFVNTLWVLVREQAQTAGISDIDFGKSLVGEAIDDATTALLESIAYFFGPRRGAAILSVAKQQREVERLGLERAVKKISDPKLQERLVALMEKKMDEELENKLRELST